MGKDDTPTVNPTQGAYQVSEETAEQARKVVAGNSVDAAECEMFFEELGLK